jgi:hypothetical protein
MAQRQFLDSITLTQGLVSGGTFAALVASDLPADTAYLDVIQTWTAAQTWTGACDVIVANGGSFRIDGPNSPTNTQNLQFGYTVGFAGKIESVTKAGGGGKLNLYASATGTTHVLIASILETGFQCSVGFGFGVAPKGVQTGDPGTALQTFGFMSSFAYSVPETGLNFTDITTGNVSSTQHGLAPKSSADATQFLNGAATPAYAQVKDSDLSTSDVTTNNVSITKHGFAPKAPNDATKYLDGTGAYSVPSGGVSLSAANTFTVGPQAINVDTVGHKGLVVKRFSAGSTGNLVEAEDQMGTAIAYFAPSGDIVAAGPHGFQVGGEANHSVPYVSCLNSSFGGTAGYYLNDEANNVTGVYTGWAVYTNPAALAANPVEKLIAASGQTGDMQQNLASDGTTVLSRITAKGWVQNTPGRARLTADVTENAAALKNLTDLSLTLVAGRKYTGKLVVKCLDSVAAEGIQFDFNGGAATMTNFWAGAGVLASGGTDVIGTNISTSLAGVINFTTLTGESVVVIEISLVCNAGGTFIPRFAQNTHAAGTATARLGSYLWLEDSPN